MSTKRARYLNTPRLVADATGTTVWRWDQAEPFGDSPADENPLGSGNFDLPLRLPGQYYDAETGLHYNYYRDYNSNIGSYGESDLIGLLGGLSTYAYATQNPLNKIDRLGLGPFEQGGRAGPQSYVPGPFDVFVPGTPSNQAFVRSINQIGSAIQNFCAADKDECYERWDKEDKDCKKWTGFGHRWVQACKDRAAARLRLCYRNGGKPDPDEPEVWRPD